MKNTLPLFFGLVIGCATGVAVRDIVVPARAQNVAGPVYEYRVTNLGWSNAQAAEEQFNAFGRQGWRVAAQTGAYVTFERSYMSSAPRQPAAPAAPAPTH
jgi:hypothetical protein